MELTREALPELHAELSRLREEVSTLVRRLSDMEERVRRIEIQEELWREPDAAGDEPPEP